MYKLIYFLRNSYVTILFLVIEIIAISRYAHSNEYTRSRLLSLSSAVTGKAQSVVHDVSSYFMLRSENAQLTRRVAQLENVLSRYRETVDDTSIEVDSTWFGGFQYMTARVVSTSVTRRDNLIVLNRGLRDGVSADMAVLAPNGMIAGYVVNCSERYSVAVSILSSAFKTSGKLYNDSYSGLISGTVAMPHTSCCVTFRNTRRSKSVPPFIPPVSRITFRQACPSAALRVIG